MNKNKYYDVLGCTRQMLHLVVEGKRNFSIKAARKASALFGGTVETWIDPAMAEIRKHFYLKKIEEDRDVR